MAGEGVEREQVLKTASFAHQGPCGTWQRNVSSQRPELLGTETRGPHSLLRPPSKPWSWHQEGELQVSPPFRVWGRSMALSPWGPEALHSGQRSPSPRTSSRREPLLSPPKLICIKSVMPSTHLILCRPLLLLPPIPPSIRVFSNESSLHMRWPKYWSFSFSIIPSKEIPGPISCRMDVCRSGSNS